MKAISLHQPWAWFVVHGFKTWETRSWSCDCFGPLLIHASQKFSKEGKELYYHLRATFGDKHFCPPGCPPWLELPRGGFVGKVEYNCCTNWPLDMKKLGEVGALLGDFSDGRWFWKLNNPVAFPTLIPARGFQRIWNVDESIVAKEAA